ncbi:ScyD/ScyE family protein [Georgenia muralis]|uniref:ScyD/ScyE family protein n=1 Tax=Georgenia muralis TaxID=154117 RepID=A0A3N5A6U7_9MICO|nr:ScyD/ScyE family protein [Georgenia muralis]RPF29125.1 hypothetical protein EDD32_3685 [Georgenia muralis]
MLRSRPALLGVAATCLVAPLFVATSSSAHKGDDGLDYEVDDLTTVATGLASPRGLDVARNGDVYVALAGRGAADPGAPDAACIEHPEFGTICLGDTGGIGRLDVAGHRVKGFEMVAEHLPSLAGPTGFEAIGPSDVSFDERGRLFATIGLGADPAILEDGGPLFGLPGSELLASVVTVDRRGDVEQVADIGEFEATDPDGRGPDTNPHSLVASRHGHVVADAGGNTLLSVKDGMVDDLVIFPDEDEVQNPFAPPGVMVAPQPVPNAVVKGPDGALYVGQLTGFPFVPGTATVWRIVPGQAPEVYADGFTNIIDLAFTDDGDLLVLQISRAGLLTSFGTGDFTGALHVVDKDDTSVRQELLVDGNGDPLTKDGMSVLFAPGGITVDDDTVYVSTQTVSGTDGSILRFELDD